MTAEKARKKAQASVKERGRRLAARLKYLNWTYGDCERATGISSSMIAKMCRGESAGSMENWSVVCIQTGLDWADIK